MIQEMLDFSLHLVCVSWNVLFDFMQKVSLCLVLLLSISRRISIRGPGGPFVRVNKKAVFRAFICYILLFCITHVVDSI